MQTASAGQGDHKEIFQGQLEELKLIINDLDTTSVTIIADWNSDLVNQLTLMAHYLGSFQVTQGLLFRVSKCYQMIALHI